MRVEIVAYRPVTEHVTLGQWPLMRALTHFRAEARITDGTPSVEIDFRYGDGPTWCAKVYADEPSDVCWMVERADGDWDEIARERVAAVDADDDDAPLTLAEIEPFARAFTEAHFWDDER